MASVQDLIAYANHESKVNNAGASAVQSLLEGLNQSQDNGLDRAIKLIQLDQLRQEQIRQKEMADAIKGMTVAREDEIKQGLNAAGTKPLPVLPKQKLEMTIEQDEKGRYSRKFKVVEPKSTTYQKAEYQGSDGKARIGKFDTSTGEIIRSATDPLAPITSSSGGVPPAGFRWKADGSLEPIPGGPADQKNQLKDKNAKALEDASIRQADTIINKVEQALKNTSGWTAGWGSLLKGVPASSAKNLETDIKTIKANLGFAELQEMRRNSPTGGALGQVAVQELEALQSAVASLDQGQESGQLRRNLGEVKTRYENWKKAVLDARAEANAQTPTNNTVIKTGFEDLSDDELQKRIDALKGGKQ